MQGRLTSRSSFGKSADNTAREAETARFGSWRWGEAKVGAFSRAVRRWGGGADAKLNCAVAQRERRASLTGVVGGRARQAGPEELPKGEGGKDGVGPAVKVPNSVEPFYS